MTLKKDLDAAGATGRKPPTYLSGFANEHVSEAIANTLPEGQNSPQKPPRGLYIEQISGTAFTAPRSENRRAWFYRIYPSVMHEAFRLIDAGNIASSPTLQEAPSPNRLRWDPFPIPEQPTDFIEGLYTIGVCGDIGTRTGVGIHIACMNRSMTGRVFSNADGEMVLLPQLGRLSIRTEYGLLEVGPGEIALIPRGVRFRVDLLDKEARCYVCENYGALLRLPDLGPIGANGLANPRDFLTPSAAFEDLKGPFEFVMKAEGSLWSTELSHSPFNVVAWHGNYAPCKYDLAHFNSMGTISFDHPDPSIFTFFTSPSGFPGVANVDVCVFPPRWNVAEHSFRPAWFHRNYMSEFMGLIHGVHDTKASGFLPGGASMHNCMAGHGPDVSSYEAGIKANLAPQKMADTLAFMFETRFSVRPTRYAMEMTGRQRDYDSCWLGFKNQLEG